MTQRITDTRFNRYPEIFRVLVQRVASLHGSDFGGRRLKILSYGCSDGAEMESLRAYFPDATIVGCDANAAMLMKAAKRVRRREGMAVVRSTPETLVDLAPFDLIVAMSVACRYPLSRAADTLSSLYPFAEFADMATLFGEILGERGLLCLYNTNYWFEHADAATGFVPVRSPLVPSAGFVDRFRPDGSRLTLDDRGYRRATGFHAAYLADGAAGEWTDAMTRDCIFERQRGGEPILLEDPFEPPDEPTYDRPTVFTPLPGSRGIAVGVRLAEQCRFLDGDGRWSRREWMLTRPNGEVVGLGPVWRRERDDHRFDDALAGVHIDPSRLAVRLDGYSRIVADAILSPFERRT